MGAVWYRARADLRHKVVSTLLLALLVVTLLGPGIGTLTFVLSIL